MRLILKKEVSHLGEAGDIVNVASGYGRNYLLPRGLAVPASAGSVKELEHQQRIADAIRRKEHSKAEALAASLENCAVSIRRKAGDDDRLFGSVTNRDIAEALAAEGIEIDRKLIHVEEPLKAIGLYRVQIQLPRGVKATVRVYVIRA